MRRREKLQKRSDDILLGEVARELRIARSTAWARCLRGEIPAEFRGGRFIVSRRTLNRLMAERERRDAALVDGQVQAKARA